MVDGEAYYSISWYRGEEALSSTNNFVAIVSGMPWKFYPISDLIIK
jgi:hypothetical protein